MHHILDANIHPFIIYYSGDHVRDPHNKTWQHGIVENLIDIYMMKETESVDPKKYPVYKDFEFNRPISSGLISTLNESLENVYGISLGGNKIGISIHQMSLFMKTFKFDRYGIKKVIFDAVDPFLKGTSSFSYHRNSNEAKPYLNEEHSLWLHPMYASIQSNESFMDLYNKSLIDGAHIIDGIEKLCKAGKIHIDDIYSLIPDVASTYGLKCGQEFVIKNKKYMKR